MKITGYVTHMIYRPKTHYKAKKSMWRYGLLHSRGQILVKAASKIFWTGKDIFSI